MALLCLRCEMMVHGSRGITTETARAVLADNQNDVVLSLGALVAAVITQLSNATWCVPSSPTSTAASSTTAHTSPSQQLLLRRLRRLRVLQLLLSERVRGDWPPWGFDTAGHCQDAIGAPACVRAGGSTPLLRQASPCTSSSSGSGRAGSRYGPGER